MSRILIFGGTTEGRELAQLCAQRCIPTLVSVTTDYGANLIMLSGYIEKTVGKLDKEQIKALLKKESFLAAVDATHPYAQLATANISAACSECGVRYIRLLRENDDSGFMPEAVLESAEEAAEYLNRDDRRALITTGSKELPCFTRVRDYRSRLTVRVFPAEGIVEHCEELGFSKENIICEKGPFSIEENIRHIRKNGIQALVSKESGKIGGYPEKVKAAQISGVGLIIIKRPEEKGISFKDAASEIIALAEKGRAD